MGIVLLTASSPGPVERSITPKVMNPDFFKGTAVEKAAAQVLKS
jgi:hypothetical protein